MKGIDISSYQGNINWEEAKKQIDFAIIRLGYGDNIERQDDSYFIFNANECIKRGIPFGVYIYSYAKRLEGNESIQSEVEHTLRQLSRISQKPFCVYIDLEDENYQSSYGKETLTDFALNFCKKITQAGYKAGVYANENWFRNYLDASKIANSGYSLWCARVSNTAPNIGTTYDIWQYSFSGRINGINGDVDLDEMLIDIIGSVSPSPISVDTKVNIYYAVQTKEDGWLPEVKNLDDYAGYKDHKIIGLKMRVDKGSIKYRGTTVSGRRLGWVTGCNVNDYYNGYAGNGEALATIEAEYYTPKSIVDKTGYQYLYYKVNNYPYQIDLIENKSKRLDGYAGVKGKSFTKFQAYID